VSGVLWAFGIGIGGRCSNYFVLFIIWFMDDLWDGTVLVIGMVMV